MCSSNTKQCFQPNRSNQDSDSLKPPSPPPTTTQPPPLPPQPIQQHQQNHHQKLTDQTKQGGRFAGQGVGVARRVVQDGVEQVVLVVAMERGLTNQHLVQQHAKRPPVHRGVVAKAFQDLEQCMGEFCSIHFRFNSQSFVCLS